MFLRCAILSLMQFKVPALKIKLIISLVKTISRRLANEGSAIPFC